MLLVPVEGQRSRIGRASYRRRIQRLAREITFHPFPTIVYIAQEIEIKKASEPVPIDPSAPRN
jgi:hypothetical protein